MHLPTPQSYEAAVLEFFNGGYPRELPMTPDMDRQRFTREVLTGYSNIAKTSLVSSQQG